MKKVISIALSLVLAVGLLSLPSASAAALANAKITDELSAAITKEGSAKAFVTMNDVDHAKVMKTFMTEYPAEFEAYTQAKFDVAASSGIEITDELVQSAVERKREIYREYYTAANQAVISACVASKNVTFVSAYSPIAIVEVNRTEALQLAKNSNVLKMEALPEGNSIPRAIDINNFVFYFKDAVDELAIANDFLNIKEIRDDYFLTGSGVKVGMFESGGVPDVTSPYLTDTTIFTRPGDTQTSEHATFIAVEIAGRSGSTKYGAAPDAHLYCSAFRNWNEVFEAVEWLINQGVNIINFSLAFNADGNYSMYDIWFDHIAVMHDIHIVSSAGNLLPTCVDNQYSPNIQSPGMAYNVITVGGYNMERSTDDPDDINLSLSVGSCHQEAPASASSPRAEKPNLVANFYFHRPRDTDEIPHQPAGGLWGTSFAAPQVAGVIAQLCSYNWQLKFKQTAVGAILMASAAEKVDGSLGGSFDISVRVEGNEQVSDKEGAGVLNALYAYNIVANGNYWSPTVYAASFPYTKTVTVQSNNTYICRIAIFWLSRVSVSNHTSGANSVTPMANLDLTVKTPSGYEFEPSCLTYANFEIIQFEPTETGTYQIIISGSSTEKEYIGIALLNEVM